MKILRKKVVNCILLCIFLAGFMMMIPQNAQAAKSKFVVKNGVLIKYNGHGKKITIPKNVRTIKEQAFFGCSDLQTVTIPGNVKKIGQCAFAYCPDLKKVVMKNGVTTIMAEAFSGCGKLDSVTIPKSTKTINELAFDETPWLIRNFLSLGITLLFHIHKGIIGCRQALDFLAFRYFFWYNTY